MCLLMIYDMSTSNGLIELVDEKSHDRGFFCLQLTSFIMHESEERQVPVADLWLERFGQAKNGVCSYRHSCSIFARTMSQSKNKNIQLQFEF